MSRVDINILKLKSCIEDHLEVNDGPVILLKELDDDRFPKEELSAVNIDVKVEVPELVGIIL